MMAGQSMKDKMAASNIDALSSSVDDINLSSEGYSASVADISTSFRPIRDSLETRTSILQDETMQQCLPLLERTEESPRHSLASSTSGIPRLEREKHVEYLRQCLGKLPAGYVAFDASRPWILYWVLAALCLLGEDVQPYKERVVQTLTPMQNPGGGYGGGNGQLSHCAPTYAAILSLAMLGDSKSLELIDRRGLWTWLGEIKQENGGFTVCVGGEEDVRGAYCAMVMISLLALPTELPPNAPARRAGLKSFTDGLPEYLSRCQTYEGGISGAPQTEAHAAYAFCALACLSILGPPQDVIPTYLDMPSLISWLSARQTTSEGGFAGRTNKLVDGCYSHWVGGCWTVVEAALHGAQSEESLQSQTNAERLYSRESLIKYILCCCQSEKGGLRDKPSTYADTYHTCYTLAGLSYAQHQTYYTGPPPPSGEPSYPLDSAMHWASFFRTTISLPDDNKAKSSPEEEENKLTGFHPIYVIPWANVKQTQSYFYNKTTF